MNELWTFELCACAEFEEMACMHLLIYSWNSLVTMFMILRREKQKANALCNMLCWINYVDIVLRGHLRMTCVLNFPGRSICSYLWESYPLPTLLCLECVCQLWLTSQRYCWKKNRRAMPHARGSVGEVLFLAHQGVTTDSTPSWAAPINWESIVDVNV